MWFDGEATITSRMRKGELTRSKEPASSTVTLIDSRSRVVLFGSKALKMGVENVQAFLVDHVLIQQSDLGRNLRKDQA